MAGDLAGRDDRARHARIQPARRRPARCPRPAERPMNLLKITDLTVSFDTEDSTVHAVKGISFALRRGEILALCGESGCGKTVTAMASPRLLPTRNTRLSGSITLDGRELTTLPAADLRQVRGKEVS